MQFQIRNLIRISVQQSLLQGMCIQDPRDIFCSIVELWVSQKDTYISLRPWRVEGHLVLGFEYLEFYFLNYH